MNDKLHLTDEQYQRVLLKIRDVLSNDGFEVRCEDSTFVGDKYTKSNCGFCNDEFTEKDTAMWPEQFPERRSMKYRQDGQKCPFDMRKMPGIVGWGSGCFFGCYLFKDRKHNLVFMRQLVADLVAATG
jgi:hypothetical protein